MLDMGQCWRWGVVGVDGVVLDMGAPAGFRWGSHWRCNSYGMWDCGAGFGCVGVLELGWCWSWANDGCGVLFELRGGVGGVAGVGLSLVLEVRVVLALGLYWRWASNGVGVLSIHGWT